MSGILDEIVAATEGAKLRSMHVPEWDRWVYWRPLTLHQREQIRKRGGSSSGRTCAVGLILGALDEAGEPLFTDDAKTLLTVETKLDGAVVARVANRIFGDEQETDKAGEASAPTRS